MKTYIKPNRIFFCEECGKEFKSDEYITLDWLNYVDVCLCWEPVKTDWHINNILS